VEQGVPLFIDAEHQIAHNKIVLIDGATVITGSFNFTKAAAETENAENLVIIDEKPKIAAAYAQNFERHLAHSHPFKG
jgi:phosphatidylserine/phosphatidylglycerophosphate/cardiolipin synthase-like enzyme